MRRARLGAVEPRAAFGREIVAALARRAIPVATAPAAPAAAPPAPAAPLLASFLVAPH
jgi:hypothetical protein